MKSTHTVTATFAEIAAFAPKRAARKATATPPPESAKPGVAPAAPSATTPKPTQVTAKKPAAAKPPTARPAPSTKPRVTAEANQSAKSLKGPSKPPRHGALEAALKILRTSGKPLTCGQIMERILKEKLWKTDGSTPAASLEVRVRR
ncbi:MAG TPA: winged helix-turn-helix domain-containing protein [Phycisphaerales bacterium]|nr:winged helix-turn-helix domain-containing protein [Phycisphaerales bacterium]